MKKGLWPWILALAFMSGGCCAHQSLFQKVDESMATVQHFYNPLISNVLEQTPVLQQAVVAADTTLMLAGELQHQWCPDPAKARQLELQVGEVKKLAQEAGVVEAAAASEPASASQAK